MKQTTSRTVLAASTLFVSSVAVSTALATLACSASDGGSKVDPSQNAAPAKGAEMITLGAAASGEAVPGSEAAVALSGTGQPSAGSGPLPAASAQAGPGDQRSPASPQKAPHAVAVEVVASPEQVVLIDEGAEQEKEPEACAGTVLEPEILTLTPKVTIFVVLDNSESMEEDNKWGQAEEALTTFVEDPESAGIKVGIQFFHPQNVRPPPDFDPAESRREYRPNKCDGLAHAQSASEVGLLPEAAPAVVAALAATGPGSNTPTVGALSGGVSFCKAFMDQNPEEECVTVLVTDGQPNGCGLNLKCAPGFNPNGKGECVDPLSEAVLTPIVRAAHADHGVKTFTVGMAGVIDDGFDLLNALAIIGGTDCTPDIPGKEACDVSETGGAGLLAALNLIRDTVVVETEVPCNWGIPEPPNGKTVNPDLVNVELSVEGRDVPLGRVGTGAECATVQGGWYYDLPAAPTEVRACPAACALIEQNKHDVRVELEFGCATRLPIVL